MKKRWITALLTCAIALLGALGFVACGKEEASGVLTLSETEINIDAYEDYALSVTSGETEIKWSSSDKEIVTVENGVVSAHGKMGNATVTATADGKKGECTVFVSDSGLKPRLTPSEQTCFLGVATELTLKIDYNEKQYGGYTVKEISVADTAIASVENGKLKGVAVGETTATATVVWKGLELTTRKEFAVKVYPELTLFLDREEYEVYDVNENSLVKKSTVKPMPSVYQSGALLDDPAVSYTVTEGGEYVEVVDGVIKVKSGITKAETATIKASYSSAASTSEATAKVTVYPAYEQKENTEFMAKSDNAKDIYYPATGTVGGRTGAYAYVTNDECKNKNDDWVAWSYRLVLQSFFSEGGESQYSALIEKKGLSVVSFDLYYAGQTNADGKTEYRGVSFNSLYGKNSASLYNTYYVGQQKNFPERTVAEGATATNTLVPNRWQTFYFDLREGFSSSNQVDLFLHSARANDEIYVDNIRYYYDNSALLALDYSGVDLEERTLVESEKNAAEYLAQANEFTAFSPAYTSFAPVEGGASYKYQMNSSVYTGEEILLLGEKQQRRIYPVNVYNGVAARQGYRYLSFEYKLTTGAPVLYAYDMLEENNVAYKLAAGELSGGKLIAFKDGDFVSSVTENEWVTLVVALDNNVYSFDSVYITVETEGTEFEIRNARYWKDASYRYELGYNELLEAELDPLDYACEGSEWALSELLFVTYRGVKTTAYEIKEATVKNGALATYEDGKLRFLAEGSTELTFVVGIKDGEHEESVTLEVPVRIYPRDLMILAQTELELYGGENPAYAARKTAKITVNTLLVDGLVSGVDALTVEAVSGGELVTIDGRTITAVGIGEAVLSVYCEKEDGSKISEEVRVVAHDGRKASGFTLGSTNAAATYQAVDGTVAGRTGVYAYTLASGNKWSNDNRLSVTATDHFGGTFDSTWAAMKNMTDNGYGYITFDFCLPAGGGFYLGSPNGTEYTEFRVSVGAVPVEFTGDPLVTLYDGTGKDVTAEATEANVWYTAAIRYDRSEGSKQWSCVHLVASTANPVYLDGAICHYDDSFKNDLHFEIPDELLVGESKTAALDFDSVYRAGVKVENVSFTFRSADESTAKCEGKTLTFFKAGTVKITVEATLDGKTTHASFNARYLEDTQAAVSAWTLKTGSTTSFADGVYTLTGGNAWVDYLVLHETDGRGTSGASSSFASHADARANMLAKNYGLIRFTISVTSGTARVYAPTSGNAQGYAAISTTSLVYSDDMAKSCIEVFAADGTKLEAGASLTAGATYTVRVYYNAATTGWSEVAIKGAATTATLGDVSFFAGK